MDVSYSKLKNVSTKVPLVSVVSEHPQRCAQRRVRWRKNLFFHDLVHDVVSKTARTGIVHGTVHGVVPKNPCGARLCARFCARCRARPVKKRAILLASLWQVWLCAGWLALAARSADDAPLKKPSFGWTGRLVSEFVMVFND